MTPPDETRLSTWLAVQPGPRVVARTGKVELGQGVHHALRRIVAQQLGVAVDRVVIDVVRTDTSPDEGYTAASASIETSGSWLRGAAEALRRDALARAARALECRPDELLVDQDGILRPIERGTTERGIALDALYVDGVPADVAVEPIVVPDSERPEPTDAGRAVELATRVGGGAAYVHDLTWPGMLHARVLLPPALGARMSGLAGFVAPAGVELVRERGILAVLGSDEHAVVRALARLEAAATWETPSHDAPSTPFWRGVEAQPTVDLDVVGGSEHRGVGTVGNEHRARYRKPYQAHAAMAPSCACALEDNGILQVWSHSQGIYPLRREVARLLELDEAQVVVEHVPGPGCYGHNGADDAAAYAAFLARTVPGTPIRLAFSYRQEMTFAPVGPAMQVDLGATLDDDGRVVRWLGDVLTDVHNTRPAGGGDRVALAWHGGWVAALARPGPSESGHRNAVPPYRFPIDSIRARFYQGPLRTSALRTLAAFTTTFANESFVDELASRARQDPVAFRLAHLEDERMRHVLTTAVRSASWTPQVGPSGEGMGVALARYKGSKAMVAIVARVELDSATGDVAVRSLWIACDAGAVIDPRGLVHQLEGGAIQGVSRTLCEAVPHSGAEITIDTALEYPMLGFRGVPAIRCTLVDRPDSPPLGAGEASTTPVAAAIANALFDASGIRMRELPITAEAVRGRLTNMDDDELDRLIL